MSTVDIQALEEAMKAAQLDQLRGYRKDTYGEVKQAKENVYVTDVARQEAIGQQILREPMFNKGKLHQFYRYRHMREASMTISMVPLSQPIALNLVNMP